MSPGELAQANRSTAQNAAAGEILRPGAGLAPGAALHRRGERHAASDRRRGHPATAPTTPADLAAANPALPLQPGALLVLGRTGPAAADRGQTLAAAAAAAGLSLLQWVSANEPRARPARPRRRPDASRPRVAAPAVTVAAADTLRRLAVRADLPVGDLAPALATLPGLLAPDAGRCCPRRGARAAGHPGDASRPGST